MWKQIIGGPSGDDSGAVGGRQDRARASTSRRDLNPMAETVLAVPFGVPIGEEEDSGAVLLPREELGVDDVVFGPGGFEGTGKGEDTFFSTRGRQAADVKVVVAGRARGVPVTA